MAEQTKRSFNAVDFAGERSWKRQDEVQLWRALTKWVSQESLRYNLCGVLVRDGSAIATDGHRLLVVNNITKGTAPGIYAVANGRITLGLVDGVFPDFDQVFLDSTMAIKPRRFLVSNFNKLRKLNTNTPLRFTSNGFSIGSGYADGPAVNLRFIAQLPFTENDLTIDVRGTYDPIIVRPKSGGWMAALMPVRIESTDAFLRETAEVANG